MKRGDIVIVREKGTLANKARPSLIVQTDMALPSDTFVTLCPITTVLRGAELIRVPIEASEETGLDHASEVEVDLISSYRVDRIARVVGRAPRRTMTLVDEALRRWLSL